METLGYTKILTLGSVGTERALIGPVVVQEKVDGSQFRFYRDADGELHFASHKADVYRGSEGMFKYAVEHLCSLPVRSINRELLFCCEYLAKPKHNTLAYATIPTNHLVLFDVYDMENGQWLDRPEMFGWASTLAIDLIPQLAKGPVTLERLQELLQTESYLGGQTVEGVVVKNHGELVAIGGRAFPLFTKLVNQSFKERNAAEWKVNSGKSQLQDYIDSFNTEARYHKAVQHLTESGVLEGSPRDIGALTKEIAVDIEEEEAENIKAALYAMHRKDIIRSAQRGFPEWYKAQLLERVE